MIEFLIIVGTLLLIAYPLKLAMNYTTPNDTSIETYVMIKRDILVGFPIHGLRTLSITREQYEKLVNRKLRIVEETEVVQLFGSPKTSVRVDNGYGYEIWLRHDWVEPWKEFSTEKQIDEEIEQMKFL